MSHTDEILTDAHTHSPNPVAGISLVDISNRLEEVAVPAPKGVFLSGGIHPCAIPDNWQATAERIEAMLRDKSLTCLGECGFDRTSPHGIELQQQAFSALAAISAKLHKAMIIHCVHAADILLRYAHLMPGEGMWTVHGFRGKPQAMRQLLDAGFSISFGARANPDSVKACPADRIFLETDTSPHEALPAVYERFSELCGEHLADTVSRNFQRICNPYA